jgi:HAE1 family hydrophobic/amphiphilic exporter-1
VNWIARSIREPVTVIVGVILTILAGLLALQRVPIQLTPDVEDTIVSVSTRWEGASPLEVEQEIVDRQEEKLQGLAGLRNITSVSQQGQGRVRLEFTVGTPKDAALREVSDKLREVPAYPENVDEPVIEASDPENRDYIAWFVLTCTDPRVDVRTLQDFVEDRVKPVLERVPGLAEVNAIGGREREVQVRFDPLLLAQRGIPVDQLVQALRRTNRNASAGAVESGKQDVRVRMQARYAAVGEVEETVVASTPQGPVRVRDVAEVAETFKEPFNFVRSRGESVIAINAQKEVGANVIEVMGRLQAAVARMNEPDGVLAAEARQIGLQGTLRLEQVYDQTIYIDDALALVKDNIWVGGLLAIAVLFLFLRSFTTSAIIGVSIPICVIGAIVVMLAMGRTVNVISLAGMAFAVGMVVDNAIVVLENTFRHLEMGKPPMRAAIDGAQEVYGAVIASTLTTLVVFIPILLIQEEAGQLFRDIALAIVASVGLSMVVAVTVVPACAARLRPRPKVKTGFRALLERIASPFGWINDAIARMVHTASGSTPARVLVVVVMTAGSIAGTMALMPPSDYLPQGNRNLVFGLIVPPPGYSLEQQSILADRIEETMRPAWEAGRHARGTPDSEVPESKLPKLPVFDFARGGRAPDAQAPAVENYFLVSFDGLMFHGAVARDPERVVDLQPLLTYATRPDQLPGTMAFAFQVPLFRLGGRTGSAVKINFAGDDLDQVSHAALVAYGDLLGKFPPFTIQPDPNNFNLPSPELRVVPRLKRLGEAGMSPAELGTVVQALGDGAIVGEYLIGGRAVDLKLVAKDGADGDVLERLRDQPIATPTGGVVPLTSLADLVRMNAAPQINREGRRRAVTLQFTPPPGLPLEQAIDVIHGILDARRADGSIPPSVDTTYTGSASKLEAVRNAMLGDGTVQGTLTSSLFLALLVCYLLMCVLFQSFVQPLVICFSVPLATFGGFAALRLVHEWSLSDRYMPVQNLDVLTMLGFVILIGVVVNNAILLVHQALNFMRGTAEEGPGKRLAPREAIAESVRTRIRPIMMTTLTSLLGMLPLVIAPGSGSELYRGLGAVVLGGLAVSTVFTLVLVPLLFSLVCDVQMRFGICPWGAGDDDASSPPPSPPAKGPGTVAAGAALLAVTVLAGGGCAQATDVRPDQPAPGVEERIRATQIPTTPGSEGRRTLAPSPARLPDAVGKRLAELETLGGPPSWAGADPALPPDLYGRAQRVEAVRIDDLVTSALEHNLGVRLRRVEAATAREGVTVEEARFDLYFTADANAAFRDEPQRVPEIDGVPLGRPEISDAEQRVAAGLARRIDTGASVRLESFLDRLNNTTSGIDYAPDPAWTTGLALSAVQPLLRGAGSAVNLADIESARLEHERRLRRTEAEMLVVSLAVEQAAWDLHEAWERLRIQQRLTERGAEVERVLRERLTFDAQPAQWSDALAVVEERRAGLVRALRDVKAVSDRLKSLVDDPDRLLATETLLTPADVPAEGKFEVALRDAIARAFENRPEVAEAVLDIDDARLRDLVARNHVFPRVDLRVGVALRGLDDSVNRAPGGMEDFVSTFVGVSVEIPIGNRAAEADERRARLAGRAALLRYEDVLRRVVLDVKSALRDLEAARDLLDAARESRIAQSENLRTLLEEEKERRSLTPEFLALKFQRQDRLATAQREEVRALASWRRALAAWRRAIGEGPSGGRFALESEE